MNWENSFLNWFAVQGIPMSEKVAALGEFRYFQFSSILDGVEGKPLFAYGCSPNRRSAAIKCAAEAMERKFLDEFYFSSTSPISATSIRLLPESLEPLGSDTITLPPKGMKTSNGWAVHSSADQASISACLEALERHLLIKSFYRWGWKGFRLVKEEQSEEIQLFYMTSRLSSAGYTGGIVAAKSPLYPGVSFGYCVGRTENISEPSFWQTALLESIGKITALGGRSIEIREDSNTWLRTEAKYYLETPFDLKLLAQGTNLTVDDDDARTCYLKVFDLAELWQLSFPLAAAFCWGGNLIPLSDQSKLDEVGEQYFRATLAANELPPSVPMRHPIL